MSRGAFSLPIPTNAPKAVIDKWAGEVAVTLQFRPGEILDPLVARLGGTIESLNPFSGNDTPSIRVENQHKFTIYLPMTTSPRRNRFTVAHELGHLLLHYPMVNKVSPGAIMRATRWVDESDKVQQRAEWEANWFAAGFLMPSDIFRARSAALSADLDKLADEFEVSRQAAELRTKTLGC